MTKLKIPARPTRKTRERNGGVKPSIESKLLAATERLLDKGQTFASLSIEQLATEAGISRGTFYLHFKDKADLVARLMDFYVEELGRGLGTWTLNAASAERLDVSIAVHAMIKNFKKHQAIIVAVRDTMPHDKKIEDIYFNMVDKIAGMAKDSVATIKKRGKSRTKTTSDVADALATVIALYCTYMLDKQDPKAIRKASIALGYICESAIFADDQ